MDHKHRAVVCFDGVASHSDDCGSAGSYAVDYCHRVSFQLLESVGDADRCGNIPADRIDPDGYVRRVFDCCQILQEAFRRCVESVLRFSGEPVGRAMAYDLTVYGDLSVAVVADHVPETRSGLA